MEGWLAACLVLIVTSNAASVLAQEGQFDKELTATARMLSSVGKEEAADRLHKIHAEFFE